LLAYAGGVLITFAVSGMSQQESAQISFLPLNVSECIRGMSIC
jgi:hypothetical protein